MLFRVALLACASVISVASAISSSSAAPMPIDAAAKLFASRSTGFSPDLSPDGDKLVYLAAGPGATTAAHIRDIKTNADGVLVHSSGKPDQLEFCGFVDERWVVCNFDGELHLGKFVYSVGRTIAVDTKTGTIKPLSTPVHDQQFLQFDGRVIDWLPDESGSILMQRNYAAESGGAERIGVDRIQIDPFKTSVVENAVSRQFDYMTDGHGSVRFRSEATTDADDNYRHKQV